MPFIFNTDDKLKWRKDGSLRFGGGGLMPDSANGGGAGSLAPFPAPTGLQWEYVTQNGPIVTQGSPVIILTAV